MRRKMITETEYNQDEIRAIEYFDAFPLWLRALFFVCIVGQCSAEQLFRWLLEFEPNENKCLKAISELKGKCLINKLRRNALKILDLGDEIIIYFATELARREMEKIVALPSIINHPGLLMVEQFLFGEPNKHKLYRVWHQLLCAESILSLLIKHYFCWFRSESQIQVEKRRYNNQLIKDYNNDTTKPKPQINYKTGDYEIQLLDKDTSDFKTFECEAVHTLTYNQIRKKPANVTYFCLDNNEAELVRMATNKDNVTVLKSDIFFEPRHIRITLKKEFYSKNTKKTSQLEILQLVHHLGGIVTASLVTLHRRQKEDYCRAILEQLYEQGYLNKVSSCLKRGTSRGRNINFYCLNLINTENDSIFESGVLRCYALMNALKEQKYIGYIYAVDGGIAMVNDKTYLIISDDKYKTPDENLERFYQIELDYPEHTLAIIGLELMRLSIYKARKSGLAFINLTKLNESKSYRKKPDKPST